MANSLRVTSPYDGHLISEVDFDGASQVESALETAYQLAKDLDKALPAHKRIEILEKTANLVEARSEEFARQAAEEGGKPLADSRVEIARGVEGIREAVKCIRDRKSVV